jgi:hypothetical protein
MYMKLKFDVTITWNNFVGIKWQNFPENVAKLVIFTIIEQHIFSKKIPVFGLDPKAIKFVHKNR